jgi:serine phosphatase RsbU (regulator of sigma subunit)
VVDARDESDQSFGHNRLNQLIKNLKENTSDLTAQVIVNTLISELDIHMGSQEQFDDITIAAAIL